VLFMWLRRFQRLCVTVLARSSSVITLAPMILARSTRLACVPMHGVCVDSIDVVAEAGRWLVCVPIRGVCVDTIDVVAEAGRRRRRGSECSGGSR
jgi:hypothetical protein